MKRRPKQHVIVLAGDVGGTNTRLGICRVKGSIVKFIASQVYPSVQYPHLETILREFMVGRGGVAAACFGIAGPVVRDIAMATNLPWKVSVRSLQRKLSVDRVSVINDLVANAYGIGAMGGRDFAVLNRGSRMTGNAAVLSAGTGLGEAVLFWNGTRHVPLPSEGGHAEFGPRCRLELRLLAYLLERVGHVSYEHVLSGSGLHTLYRFLKDSRRFGREPAWLRKQLAEGDPAAVISEAARLRKSRLCDEALDLFASIYGAAAGNLALQVMAVAGVYIGGGIAPKILWKLREGGFMRSFRDKGRLSPLVARIPVRVIMNDQAALFGAAVHAAELADG